MGICGSDVHFWTQGGVGDYIVRKPMALGHEASAVVSKLGQGVTSLKVGELNCIGHNITQELCFLG